LIHLRDIEKAVDEKTAIVAVSHVSCRNGFRHDLRTLSEIAHAHGAKTVSQFHLSSTITTETHTA